MAKSKSGNSWERAAERARHVEPPPLSAVEIYESLSGIVLTAAARELIEKRVTDLEIWAAVIDEGQGKSVFALFQNYLDRAYCGQDG